MKAVVFDFDGVLCDSMPQHVQAYADVLAPLGIPVRPERVYELEGARSESIIASLAEDAGRVLGQRHVHRLADEKQQAFRDRGPPPLFPLAPALVEAAGSPLGLVTGTRKENLERLMPDLLPRFDAVLAQADYTHDKPHPEPYEAAAKRLGIDPADCLCIENAPRGIASAKAAGYGEVWAVATTMPVGRLDADRVAPDHARLLTMLQERG